MAGLLIGGSIEAIRYIKERRAAKRNSTLSSLMPATDASPPVPTPASSTADRCKPNHGPNTERISFVDIDEERTRLDKIHSTEMRSSFRDNPAPPYQCTVPQAGVDAPPAYHAPSYACHRSDKLLESSELSRQHRSTHSSFPRSVTIAGSNPITTHLDVCVTRQSSIAESPAEAQEAERQGRRKCIVGLDGRCACGQREKSPSAPLGETVKERRDRKWKEKFSFGSPGFWGLVGVSLAR